MLKANLNTFTKENAHAYISYMIVSSYFHKADLVNKRQMNRLFLDYQEMPAAKQYKAEDLIIGMMETLPKKSLAEFRNMNCKVSLEKEERGYKLLFDTEGFGKVTAKIEKGGKVNISLA